MRNRATPWFFLAPFLVAFTAFFVAPVGYAVYLSLFIKKRSGFGPAKDVFGGLTNYIRAFQDADFLHSLLNIALFLVDSGAADAAHRHRPGAGARRREKRLRAALFSHRFLPALHRAERDRRALLWGYLYSKNLSPLNQITGVKTDFLASGILLFSIGNIVTWTWTGYNMITLYAALQNVPGDLYEAARIDGASSWNVTRYIKLPLLRPALTLTAIFSVIGTMQIFSEPFVLRPLGYVPDNITPNTYLYLVVARDGNFGYGATLAIVLALFTFILSGFFLRNARGEA